MPTSKMIVTIAGAAAVVGLAGAGIGAVLDDPNETVGVINLSGAPGAQPSDPGGTNTQVPAREELSGAPGAQPSDPGGTNTQVPALEELSGVVARVDEDFDDLALDRVDLDFGPDSWLFDAPVLEDYDQDGTAEPMRTELEGLVGQQASMSVRLDNEGDDGDVYVINGLTYRDVSGPAPWQSGDAASEDDIRAAAAAAVGDGARVVDLEPEDGRTVAWEAEVFDANGHEYVVVLDAAGNVLDARRD